MVPYVTAVNIGGAIAATGWPRSTRHRTTTRPAPPRYANRYIWSASEVAAADCQGTGVTWDAALGVCYLGNRSEWVAPPPGPCPGVRINGTCHVGRWLDGCVEERGRDPHALTDAPPAIAPFTRPNYWPSWQGVGNPDAEAMHNSYLPVAIDESVTTTASSNMGPRPPISAARKT